ncbi:MAG: tetratricopeptide repeat protein [Thalassotalea sp.]
MVKLAVNKVLLSVLISALLSTMTNAQEHKLSQAKLLLTQRLTSPATLSSAATQPETNKALLPAHLADKFYRQALYFYFQNKPQAALRQLSLNQDYFAKTEVNASLFQAGLQISQDLHQDAQQLLAQLSQDVSKQLANNPEQQTAISQLQKTELLVIVYLQLAEQKIGQQEMQQAKSVLANISAIPAAYLPHYYLLQQLLAWPEQPKLDDFNLTPSNKKHLNELLNTHQAPYLVLNEALSAMSLQQYSLAEKKLKVLQTFIWSEKNTGFWQRLFADQTSQTWQESSAPKTTSQQSKALTTSTFSETELKIIEQKGLNQYAQLLLAQVYIEQGLFQQSYQQLQSFPNNTPFSEQALFLFAYSAFKLKNYSASAVVLETLITSYPYSSYTQQAWALSAEQYLAQEQLNLALDRYLKIELFYQHKQQELAEFATSLTEQQDFLSFYQKVDKDNNDKAHNAWLKLSLQQTDISTLYQQLTVVKDLNQQLQAQAQKGDWLATTIALNVTRQNNIRAQQKNANYPEILTRLANKKVHLSALLAQAKISANGELFANQEEAKLLQRISNSEQSLAFINGNKPATKASTLEYQARLTRVQGVLAWQLQQQFPVRYWQTQQALNEFQTSYLNAQQQYQNVERLLQGSSPVQVNTRLLSDDSTTHHGAQPTEQANTALMVFADKQQGLKQRNSLLGEKTYQLKIKLEQQLLAENRQFIAQQQRQIQAFLLFNQRAMANVIERLNHQEAL